MHPYRIYLRTVVFAVTVLVGCQQAPASSAKDAENAQQSGGASDAVSLADASRRGPTDSVPTPDSAAADGVTMTDTTGSDAAAMDTLSVDISAVDTTVVGMTDTAAPDGGSQPADGAAPLDSFSLPSAGIKKWVRFSLKGAVQFGRVVDATVYVLSGDFLAGGKPTGKTHPLSAVKLLAPVIPGKVLAIGLNYTDHAGSSSSAPPPAFFKQPGCIVGPDAPILRPKGATNLHFEGEIVLVIGKEAADVPESKALDYLFGVTAGNDVSERTWQSSDLQWFRAKGADTFGPIGPSVVSGAAVQSLTITTAVNGKVVQDSSAKLMIHSIKKIISFVSSVMKLHPGDVIFTGTPGKTFALNNGDKVTVTVEHVGALSNVVMAK